MKQAVSRDHHWLPEGIQAGDSGLRLLHFDIFLPAHLNDTSEVHLSRIFQSQSCIAPIGFHFALMLTGILRDFSLPISSVHCEKNHCRSKSLRVNVTGHGRQGKRQIDVR